MLFVFSFCPYYYTECNFKIMINDFWIASTQPSAWDFCDSSGINLNVFQLQYCGYARASSLAELEVTVLYLGLPELSHYTHHACTQCNNAVISSIVFQCCNINTHVHMYMLYSIRAGAPDSSLLHFARFLIKIILLTRDSAHLTHLLSWRRQLWLQQ